MRFHLITLVLAGVILSAQQANFRFDDLNREAARNIAFHSSYWLSNHPQLDPNDNHRLVINGGFSFYFRKIHGTRWVLPDLDIAVRITRNLSLTAKLYGFQVDKDAPQVIGSGFQYYFGNEDNKAWVTSFQRVDLKGIAHFRLTSITMNVQKWFSGSFLNYSIGAGANIFRERSYYHSTEIPGRIEGESKYFDLDAIIPFKGFRLGAGIKIHPESQLFRTYIMKAFF